MSTESPSRWARLWPWLAIVLMIVPAAWHVLDFPEDIDSEFPFIERPTFSPLPPPAYRLAEPGDTLDRIAIYLSSASILVSIAGWRLTRRETSGTSNALWPTAMALSVAALYYASTPLPTFDGWHGLGFVSFFDPTATVEAKALIATVSAAITLTIVWNLVAERARFRSGWDQAGRLGVRAIWLTSLILVAVRFFEIPGLQPRGYWERCSFDTGLVGFLAALIRSLPAVPEWSRRRRFAMIGVSSAAWLGLVVLGVGLSWYHRPLSRLKEVVPGRIYMSAMPTYRGLQVAHARHKFKTIINLYNEDGPDRSPYLDGELQFVRENGIRYLNSPPNGLVSDPFLDETLKIPQDPNAWPILVHCHGCNDRTPAWMGTYRFLIEKKPLLDIIQEIERHRGYRPKAIVTLLFNRILPKRDPARFESDPVAKILKECAKGTTDPYFDKVLSQSATASKPKTDSETR